MDSLCRRYVNVLSKIERTRVSWAHNGCDNLASCILLFTEKETATILKSRIGRIVNDYVICEVPLRPINASEHGLRNFCCKTN